MNLRIFTLASLFISGVAINEVASASEWKIDFSRRLPLETPMHVSPPAPAPKASAGEIAPTFVQKIFLENDPSPEIVILNTEKGFVPSTVSLMEGQSYKIHVVNVNEQNKNISFVLDAFSQHHATFYGQTRSFVIKPDATGVFRFSSPETSAIGKIVVMPVGEGPIRIPASK